MSDASQFFAIRNLSLTNSGWTAVEAPIGCNYWVVRAVTGNVLICSDQTNPNGTGDTLAPGTQEGTFEKQTPISGVKFPAGTIFCYVQSQGASGVAVATFAV